jgi:hypothetical protein
MTSIDLAALASVAGGRSTVDFDRPVPPTSPWSPRPTFPMPTFPRPGLPGPTKPFPGGNGPTMDLLHRTPPI